MSCSATETCHTPKLTRLLSIPTVNSSIDLEGTDDSGFKTLDKAVTRPVEISLGKFKPGLVVTRSGQMIKPPNRLRL